LDPVAQRCSPPEPIRLFVRACCDIGMWACHCLDI
jgi:hypothetical protein